MVEVNWGEGWVEVTNGMHSLADLDPNQDYTIEIRVSVGLWQSSTSTLLPSENTEESESSKSDPSPGELGLLYGVIFGVLIIACIVIVLLILVLKYVQMYRREGDKGECVCVGVVSCVCVCVCALKQ